MICGRPIPISIPLIPRRWLLNDAARSWLAARLA